MWLIVIWLLRERERKSDAKMDISSLSKGYFVVVELINNYKQSSGKYLDLKSFQWGNIIIAFGFRYYKRVDNKAKPVRVAG